MVKNNNVVPNAHFKKQWQRRVKCWFNQPARKKRRRLARQAKAAAVAPRPVSGLLRPVVRCPTQKYNMRVRAGRGFTLEELKAAGINAKEARNIGIAVDFRRKNKNVETLQANVARLTAYKGRLVLFPRRSGVKNARDTEKPGLMKTADSASLAAHRGAMGLTGDIMPITNAKPAVEFVSITDEMKEGSAYLKLREARNAARTIGPKLVAKINAEEEAKSKGSKKKKKKKK